MQRSEVEAAAGALGIMSTPIDELTHELINDAMRSCMRDAHPDTSIVGNPERIQQIKYARNLLRAWVEEKSASPACRLCHGTGRVQRGFGSIPCPNVSCR